jgi:hypothetical protein
VQTVEWWANEKPRPWKTGAADGRARLGRCRGSQAAKAEPSSANFAPGSSVITSEFNCQPIGPDGIALFRRDLVCVRHLTHHFPKQPQRRKSVRSAIVLALSATSVLATVSVASAQDDQRSSKRVRATTNAPAATQNASTSAAQPDDANALITKEQEIAIPYRACIDARGWVNGRLVCRND